LKKLNLSMESSGGALLRDLNSRDDLSFVLKSLIRDYTHPRNPWAGSMDKKHLVYAVKATILSIIEDNETFIVMAVDKDKPDKIYGFACYEQPEGELPIVHYIYVKAGDRGKHFGTDLLNLARKGEGKPFRYSFRNGSRFLADGRFVWNEARRTRKKETK
jgi:hypothetical protein